MAKTPQKIVSIYIQQNPGDAWFWHPNHAYWKASDIWTHYFLTFGRGDNFILNMPPNTTGVIPEEYAAEGAAFGTALRESFTTPVASLPKPVNLTCSDDPSNSNSIATIDVPSGGVSFNAIRSIEDLTRGQRIANYTIEIIPDGSSNWVPVEGVHGITVGFRVFDFVGGNSSTPQTLKATQARFRCIEAVENPATIETVDLFQATPPS